MDQIEDQSNLTFYDKARINELSDFLNEPSSSEKSFYWNSLLAMIVIVHILFTLLESIDGPNQYTGRVNKATFPFMPTELVMIIFLELVVLVLLIMNILFLSS